MEKSAKTQIDGMEYSVLMSVYAKDNPEYLQTSIDSMVNQTVAPEQIVLVVDGPVPAEIENVINQYGKKTELFTVVSLKKNEGLANALNVGLKYCRNELVARMDADDISLPTRCERELELFAKYPELAVCGCNIDEFYDDIRDIRTSRNVPEYYEEILKFSRRRQPFNHPTVIYKRDIVIKCGGYQKLRRKEDFDLFSRILSMNYYVRNIAESLYLYRANENNYKRRKSLENMKSAFLVYERHLKRNCCSIFDFIVICGGEIVFCILPDSIMKLLSDKMLRNQKK